MLHDFSGGADGGDSIALPLIGLDGCIYGTTAAGGDAVGLSGDGVLFAFSQSDATYTVLHRFQGPEGSEPESNLIQDGNGKVFRKNYPRRR